jgi:hypothetical protein
LGTSRAGNAPEPGKIIDAMAQETDDVADERDGSFQGGWFTRVEAGGREAVKESHDGSGEGGENVL